MSEYRSTQPWYATLALLLAGQSMGAPAEAAWRHFLHWSGHGMSAWHMAIPNTLFFDPVVPLKNPLLSMAFDGSASRNWRRFNW